MYWHHIVKGGRNQMYKKALLFVLIIGIAITPAAFAGMFDTPVPVDLKLKYIRPGWDVTEVDQYMPAGEHILQIAEPSKYAGEYAGFCVDPTSAYYGYKPYQLVNLPETEEFTKVAYIFQKYGSAFTGVYDDQVAYDAQVVIWNILFDGEHAVPAESATQTAMMSDMNAHIEGFVPFPGIALAQSGEYQNFIIRVPEPGSILLLGLGLMGVASLLRFKKN